MLNETGAVNYGVQRCGVGKMLLASAQCDAMSYRT